MQRGRRKSGGGPTPSPVRVAVRIRPPISQHQHERDDADDAASSSASTLSPLSCASPSASSPTTTAGCNALQFHHENQTKAFTFDHVFTPDSIQKDVYTTALLPLLTPFLNGFNVTVLAYGQTGSGKTYTVGNKTSSTPVASPARPDEPGGGGKEPQPHRIGNEDGLLPRFLCDLFAALRKEPSVKTIHVSFLEIYCDEVRDLLQQQTRSQHYQQHQNKDNQLSIREDEHKVWVENLRQLQVENVQKALELMNLGRSRQVVGHNAINDTSSRSHAIYTMEVARKFVNEIKKTKLTFVDLAGSERLKKTQVEGVRMKESIQINGELISERPVDGSSICFSLTSSFELVVSVGLLALGNVINALGDDKSQKRRNSLEGAEAAASAPFVPYRSSKLTRLLRDSLGGNSMTLFIACVSPLEVHGSETLSTLQYANRARNIQNKAEKNVENLDSGGSSPRNSSSPWNGKRVQRTASEIEIRSLQEQVCFLQQQLDQAKAVAASANVVGTNIPSLSLQVQIPPLHTKLINDVRMAERGTLMKESAADRLGLALPVISVTTKASGIRPPSQPKLTLPMSPNAATRSTIPISVGIAVSREAASENDTGVVTKQAVCPNVSTTAAAVGLLTRIESTCRLPSKFQNGELTLPDTEEVSLETHAECKSTETNGDFQFPVMIREEASGATTNADRINCTRTEQHGQDPPIAFVTLSDPVQHGTKSSHEMASLEEVVSGNGQPLSEIEAEADDDDTTCAAESPTNAISSKTIESSKVELTFERRENLEVEVPPFNEANGESISLEDATMNQNFCDSGVDGIADSEVTVQDDVLQGTPYTGICEQAPVTQQDVTNKSSACKDKPQRLDGKALDIFATRLWCDPVNCDYHPAVVDDNEETTFLVVGAAPDSDSDDEFSSSLPTISPEASPIFRCTTVSFVAEHALKVSSHQSENCELAGVATSFPGDGAGNQEPHEEAATAKGDSLPSKEREAQSMNDIESVIETIPEPDFVLCRPPPCQTLMSPCAHRRGRLSPHKHPLRPMSVFDFDDSWEKLQRSRPPSSVSRLESLVKSIGQLVADEIDDNSNQDEAEEDAHTSPTSAGEKCLQAITSYFTKRRQSLQRIAKLKHRLLDFDTLLGFPQSVFDERELRMFVVSHQKVYLHERVDFCEAIVAQRVFRRLQSKQEAKTELSGNANSNLDDIFLSDDQFRACEEWFQHQLFDRAYFQRHVLPLVLNGWITVTPTDLEKEDAWLAL